MRSGCVKSLNNQISNLLWQHLLRTDLDNAWLPDLPRGQQGTKVKIVCEDYKSVLARKLEDFRSGADELPSVDQ